MNVKSFKMEWSAVILVFKFIGLNKLRFNFHNGSLLGNVESVKEFSDVLILDCGGLLDKRSWNNDAKIQ